MSYSGTFSAEKGKGILNYSTVTNFFVAQDNFQKHLP